MNNKEVEENNKVQHQSKIRKKVKKNKEPKKDNNRSWIGQEDSFVLPRFKDNWLNQDFAEVEWLP